MVKHNKKAPKKKASGKADGFSHSLFERLEAWAKLLAKRGDLELTQPLKIAGKATGASRYPADAAAFAKQATSFSFSYRFAGSNDKGENASGFLYLCLDGNQEDAYLELDGKQVEAEAMSMLDADGEGTGHAAWFVLREGKPPLIIWDLESLERFSSLDEYLAEGARRAFAYDPCWQARKGAAPLSEVSLPKSTPVAKLKQGLVARGASEPMADDLIRWLGADVRLVLPLTSSGPRDASGFGPGVRVKSKVYANGARGTVLEVAKTEPDSFYGSEFALVDHDHGPTLWIPSKWVKAIKTPDLYETLAADPVAELAKLAKLKPRALLTALSRISPRLRSYSTLVLDSLTAPDAAQLVVGNFVFRYLGLVRRLPIEVGTSLILGLLEPLFDGGPENKSFALDGSEFERSDYDGKGVVSRDGTVELLCQALVLYWLIKAGEVKASAVKDLLTPKTAARAKKFLKGVDAEGWEYLDRVEARPSLRTTFPGPTSFKPGLGEKWPLVGGNGY